MQWPEPFYCTAFVICRQTGTTWLDWSPTAIDSKIRTIGDWQSDVTHPTLDVIIVHPLLLGFLQHVGIAVYSSYIGVTKLVQLKSQSNSFETGPLLHSDTLKHWRHLIKLRFLSLVVVAVIWTFFAVTIYTAVLSWKYFFIFDFQTCALLI